MTSLKVLAERAEKMPWEDRSPVMFRLQFQNAMTAEVFLEMLRALEQVSRTNSFREFNDLLPTIRAAIAKATKESA